MHPPFQKCKGPTLFTTLYASGLKISPFLAHIYDPFVLLYVSSNSKTPRDATTYITNTLSSNSVSNSSSSSNIQQPPITLCALRALDLLSVLLADPLLQQQQAQHQSELEHPSHVASSSLSSSLTSVASPTSSTALKTSSAPTSRRQSVIVPPASLPRHVSDTTLQFSNAAGTIHSTNSQPPSANEKDLRRRIIKQCLEIKRLFDKEGPYLSPESPLQKTLFGKSSSSANGGASLLLRCLKIVPDVDLSIIVTNLLLRFINNSDSGTQNVTYLAKKGASICLILCFLGISNTNAGRDVVGCKSVGGGADKKGREVTPPSGLATGSQVPQISGLSSISRADEVLQNLLALMVKVGKYDPKLGLLARLNGCLEHIIDSIRKWHEKRDWGGVTIGLQALKVMGNKHGKVLAAAVL
jgi:hypothetical protein